MTTTVTMLAPQAGQTYVGQSGSSYTSDVNSLIYNVAIVDVLNLVADGLVIVTSGGRNNLTATTNPTANDDTGDGYVIGSVWFNKSTGILWVATAVTLTAAAWSPQSGGQLGDPWVTGRFYGLPPGSTQAAVLTVLGTIYAVPIFIPNQVTLSTINMSVTSGQTGGKCRGALFADNGAGYPGAIVAGTDTGDLDGTATAVVTKSALAKVLAPGLYWFGSIYTASSTMPSVIGSTAIYGNVNNALLGSDTAAHALATSGQATTGISKTGQTYPAVDMPTSFPTFPASGALVINATSPIASLGV